VGSWSGFEVVRGVLVKGRWWSLGGDCRLLLKEEFLNEGPEFGRVAACPVEEGGPLLGWELQGGFNQVLDRLSLTRHIPHSCLKLETRKTLCPENLGPYKKESGEAAC
jgi:hypothetical protein